MTDAITRLLLDTYRQTAFQNLKGDLQDFGFQEERGIRISNGCQE